MRILTAFLLAISIGVSDFAQANPRCPDNGITQEQRSVQYNLVLTEADVSPDGYSRRGILVNGQFPGPLLELCQGNDVEISVINRLPYSTTVHFHGMFTYDYCRNS